MDNDEFVGPFASWTNIKIAYGAVGDGTTDDTAAFQRALDALATAGHTPMLYIPAGTYKITSNTGSRSATPSPLAIHSVSMAVAPSSIRRSYPRLR
jgi:hypothetical protein